MNELLELAASFGPRLLWTSLQAAALVVLITVTLKLRPHWPAGTRSLLWWLVGLQVMTGLSLPTAIPLPLLQTVTVPAPQAGTAVLATVVQPPPGAPIQIQPALPARTFWIAALCSLWALIALWKCLQLVAQWRQNRELIRRSVDGVDAVRALGHEVALGLGLQHCPDIRQSTTIRSPQVSGCLRPVILLPAGHDWSDAELRLVLGHELAHIRRGDLWLGWVMAVAEHLLWFHPLVGWAARQYALNRELACDQLALRKADTASVALYGRLLLQVSVQPAATGRLMSASDSFLTLRQRLLALQQRQDGRWDLATVAAMLLALLGALPYQLTAASNPPIPTAPPPSAPVPPSPPLPPQPPLPPPRDASASSATTAVPVQLSASPTPAWPSPPGAHIHAPAYALIVPTPRGNYEESTASPAELSSLQALARQNRQALWWSQRGKDGYLITDAQHLDMLRRIYAPISQYWIDSGRLSGRYWSARGQLEGLNDWQNNVIAQQQTLDGAHDPGHAARTRDLQRQLDEIHHRSQALWQQLDGMREEIAANQRQGAQLMQQANADAQRLLSQAIADGRARRYDLKP